MARGRLGRYIARVSALTLIGAGVLFAHPDAQASSYTIVPGGPAVTVTTAAANENATASFAGTAGRRVSLVVSNVTIGTSTTASMLVSILKPDGTALAAAVSMGTRGGFIDSKTLPVSGTYRIVVDPQSTATGSATLTLYDVPAAVTGSITPGGAAVTLTTTVPGQNGKVTFAGTAGGRISLKVGPTCCSVKITILKPDDTALVAATSIGTAGGFIDTKTLPVGGTYSIVFDPQSSAVGAVTLTLYDVPAAVTGSITPGGAAVTLTTTVPGQNGKLTFAGAADDRISLQVAPSCCSVKITILKPDGTALAAATSISTAGGFIDTKTLPVGGTYSIVVDPQIAAVGAVTLQLYAVPADVTTSITPGAATTLSLATPGQNGTLTFAGTAGRGIALKLSAVTIGTTTSSSLNLSIRKPDGTNLLAPKPYGTNGGFIDTMTLPTSGTYSIVVDPLSFATGSITLTLYDVPPQATGTISAGGAPVSLTLALYQNGRVTFAGTAGHRVSLRAAFAPTACCTVDVSILNPSGTRLVNPVGISSGETLIDGKTLPTTGTYTIVVDPFDTAAGTVTLTLYDVPADVAATATLGGPSVTVTTTAASQNAQVTFAGTAGDGVVVKLGPGNCCSVYVSVLKPDGTTLVAPTLFGTAGGVMYAKLPVSGTYTVLIDYQSASFGSVVLTLVRDNTPPTAPTLSLSEGVADGFVQGTTFFYRPAGTGSVSVTATASDPGSGVQKVTFAGLGGGFTPATTITDFSLPYLQTYSWAAGATYAGPTNAVTVYDNLGNTSSASFAVTPDSAAPTTTDNTAALGTAWKNTNQTVTLSPSDGAGSGTAATRYTTDGTTPTGSSPAGTSISLTLDGVYTIKYFSVDNVGNTEAVKTAGTQIRIDKTSPSSAVLNTLPGAIRNGQVLTGSGADALSGVASISYYYCAGGACTPSTLIGSSTTGPSYSVTWNSQPADGTYQVLARVTDVAGNTRDSAKQTITVDNSNPLAPTITAFPPNPSNSTAPSFSFAGEAGATFACAIDGGAFTACTSPKPYSGLATGSHTFQVRQTDTAGNAGPAASYTWTIDTTPPAAPSITANPPALTSSTSASFSFTGEAGASFSCQLDGGAFTGCPSPKTYSGLAPGSHTFQVRQTDTAGNTGPTAAFTWTIDTTAPAAPNITANPANPTNSTSASFSFTGEGGATFACQLDGGGFAACPSPKTYSGLAAGSHTFQVHQTDTAGNTGPNATFTWTIDTTAPAAPNITANPANPTNSTSASFSFSGEAGATIACQLDGGGFAACPSPKTYSGLAAGSHTFQVHQTDTAGNTGPNATFTWSIDLTAPAAPSITAHPSDPASSTSASFSFTGEGGATFQCQLDGGGFAACGSPEAYTSLSEISHTFQVRQTDGAGNMGPAASYTWTIDTTAPDTTIDSAPSDPSGPDVTFAFSATEASSFACSLDGGAFVPCTSPIDYTGLASGVSHLFDVRATDLAGNTDLTPPSFTWTVT